MADPVKGVFQDNDQPQPASAPVMHSRRPAHPRVGCTFLAFGRLAEETGAALFLTGQLWRDGCDALGHDSELLGRGRDGDYSPPPAQIRTCTLMHTALASGA
jgi:hypothetical protein